MENEATSSFTGEPKEVRVRRAMVLAGVGLVWTAFMASLGLFLPALVVLVATVIGTVWIVGLRGLFRLRVPRPDLRGLRSGTSVATLSAVRATRGTSRRSAAAARNAGLATTRKARAVSRRVVTASRGKGSSGARRLVTAGRATGTRLSTAASSTKNAAQWQRTKIAARQQRRRAREPRIDEALASNSRGIALAKEGKHAEAIDAFDEALALLAETDDRHHEGQVLANLGTVHRKIGGTEAARFCWARALERLEPGTPESERTAELLGVR